MGLSEMRPSGAAAAGAPSTHSIAESSKDKRLHSYALLKAFVNDGQDYLDAFVPFVLEAVTDNYSSPSEIQERIQQRHDVAIPVHVVRTLVGRLCKQSLVEKARNRATYRLTDSGRTRHIDDALAQDTERRINALCEDLKSHLEDDGLVLTLDEVRQETLQLIQSQVDSFVQFLYGSEDAPEARADKEFAVGFVEYLKIAKHRKPDHYETLSQLIMGALLAWVIGSRSEEDFEVVEEFSGCALYLDTNVVFTLLGLRDEDLVKAGQELLELIERNNFSLRVFDFTISEILSVVDGYLRLKFQAVPAR